MGNLLRKYGLIFFLCFGYVQSYGQKNISDSALRYLNQFIDTVKTYSIKKDSVDWVTFSKLIYDKAENATNAEETYPAIRAGLKYLKDGHSYLMTATETRLWLNDSDAVKPIAGPKPEGKVLKNIGYIKIPWFDSGNKIVCLNFADTIQKIISVLDDSKLKGWIIDLRGNIGGNMWPMLSGVGSLLDTSSVGSFVYPNGNRKVWFYENGNSGEKNVSIHAFTRKPFKIKNENLPIAILMDERTASSGEAIAICFIGQKNVKTFGVPTRGLTTGNKDYRLADGALLLLNTSVYADRDKKMYGGKINPDYFVKSKNKRRDFIRNRAIKWILDK